VLVKRESSILAEEGKKERVLKRGRIQVVEKEVLRYCSIRDQGLSLYHRENVSLNLSPSWSILAYLH